MVKSVGEHWVCAVLARMNWAAALTRDGLERTDILAVQAGGERRTVEIQVKAATDEGSTPAWWMNKSAQKVARSDREWFALVLVPPALAAPLRTFVVPRDHVVAATWISHQAWATDPGVPAGKRKATNVPRMPPSAFEAYEHRWDLLQQPTTEVPILLSAASRQLALESRIGMQSDHPWAAALPQWG
jgi:hypothetical protein